MSRISFVLISSLGLVLAATGIGFASSGGGGGGFISPEWQDLIWRVVNLVLFLLVIYFLAWDKIKSFFSDRREQISSELQNIEDRKKQAEEKLKEVEKNISGIEQERQEILDQAKQQGEALKNSIIEKAQEDAERIKQQARTTASQEMYQEIERLRTQVAEEIINYAQEKIQNKLGQEEQEKLIDNYLTKVVVN